MQFPGLDGCFSLRATPPISFWAQIYFFLAIIHLFDITYLSKSFNLSEKWCKMIDKRPNVQRVVNDHWYCVGATTTKIV